MLLDFQSSLPEMYGLVQYTAGTNDIMDDVINNIIILVDPSLFPIPIAHFHNYTPHACIYGLICSSVCHMILSAAGWGLWNV